MGDISGIPGISAYTDQRLDNNRSSLHGSEACAVTLVALSTSNGIIVRDHGKGGWIPESEFL